MRGLYGIAGPRGPGTLHERRSETLRVARAFLDGGAVMLQLRDKHASGRELVETARALLVLTREARVPLIVNDRLDVALVAGADGVHLGQEDLHPSDALAVLQRAGVDRRRFLVGLSTHDEAQVREALALGVDYIGFGPVFGTTTKADALPRRGVEALVRAVHVAGALPVVAIGGITLENVHEVARSGAAMAAVISDVQAHPVPAARARALHERLSS